MHISDLIKQATFENGVRRVTPGTEKTYTAAVKKLTLFFGDRALGELRPVDVGRWLLWLDAGVCWTQGGLGFIIVADGTAVYFFVCFQQLNNR